METTGLLEALKSDYPHLHFAAGGDNSWSPKNQRVNYREPIDPPHLLHEVGHAVLGHADYQLDIELLKIEADAWAKAQEIAPRYGVKIERSLVDSCLETYKHWLLKQSLCPECRLAGIQGNDRLYSCPNCQNRWSVSLRLGCAVKTELYHNQKKKPRGHSPRVGPGAGVG